jgi:hypothetical protein
MTTDSDGRAPAGAAGGTPCSCLQDDAAAAVRAISEGADNELLDESHLRISLKTCRHCGQVFLYVMTETIDWQDGDDPITRVFFPVSAERASSIRRLDLRDHHDLRPLGLSGRFLVDDWPSGGPKVSSWHVGSLPFFRHD